MKARLLASLAVINSVRFSAMIVGFFTILGRDPSFTWLFAFGALLNAILFLVLYRHVRRNPALSEARRNFWEIILFLGSPVTYPLYIWKFVLPRGAA